MIGSNLVQSVVRRFNNLLDTAAAANGAGMVGFIYATAYAGNTVGAWLKGLANSAGATFIAWAQAGGGGLLRTLAARHAEVYPATDYAVGDGVTNDTVALQAFITWVPVPTSGTATIDGMGKTYAVSTLNLKNNVTLRNFNFFKIAGTVDMTPVLNIDGTSAAKSGIRLENVYIDGNRANQTNIADGSAENGGRHGIRLVGSCSKIRIYNSSANNCACDGLMLYSNGAVVNAFTDIVIEDFTATGNRRHGMSMDSVAGVRLVRPRLNGNNLDLNTVDALTVGTRASRVGATLAGAQYGNGLDAEGYGNYSTVQDLEIIGGEALGNATAGLHFFPNGTNYAGGDFVPWQRIRVIGTHTDTGVSASSDGFSLEFQPPAATAAAEVHFRECHVVGAHLQTPPILRNCLNVKVNGDVRLPIGSTIAQLVNSNAIEIDLACDRDNNQVAATNSTYMRKSRARPTTINLPTVTFDSGAAGAIGSLVATEIDYDGRGYVTWLVTFNYAATATGTTILDIGLPAGVTLIDIEANSTTAAGAPNQASMNFQLATPRVYIPQTNGATTNNALIVKARLSGT